MIFSCARTLTTHSISTAEASFGSTQLAPLPVSPPRNEQRPLRSRSRSAHPHPPPAAPPPDSLSSQEPSSSADIQVSSLPTADSSKPRNTKKRPVSSSISSQEGDSKETRESRSSIESRFHCTIMSLLRFVHQAPAQTTGHPWRRYYRRPHQCVGLSLVLSSSFGPLVLSLLVSFFVSVSKFRDSNIHSVFYPK